MKITELRATNLRGFTFTQPLTGRDILTGPNGHGKTSRLDTIDYVLQGYSKRQGQQISAMLDLFAGDAMKLGLSADNAGQLVTIDREIERRFVRKTGSVKAEQTITTTLAGSGTQEIEAAIRVAFGSVPEALDLRELLGLSVAERRRLIFGFADLTKMGWDRESCLAKIRERVITHDVKAKADLLAQCEAHLGLLAKEWGSTTSVQEGLARLVKWSDEAAKTAKGTATEAEKGARALADQAGKLDAAGDPRETAAALQEARAELSELQAKQAVDADRRKQITSRMEAISKTKQRIAALESPDVTEPAALVSLRARLAELRQPLPATKPIEDQIAALRCQLQSENVSDEEIAAAEEERRRTGAVELSTHAEAERMKSAVTDLLSAIEAMRSLAGHECDTCKRPLSSDEAEAQITRWQERIITGTAAFEVAQSAAVEAHQADIAATQRVRELLARQKAARKLCDEITTLKHRLTTARTAEKTRAEDLEREQKRMADMAADAGRAAEKRLDDLRAEKARLLELQGEDAGAPTLMDESATEAQIASIEARITALDARREEQQKADGLEGLRLEAARRRVDADNAVLALRAIKEAVGPKGLQGDVCGALVSPLENAANELLALVREDMRLGIDLEDENGNEDFDFCWVKPDGSRVRWNQLSAGYVLIFGAALSIALVTLRRPPCKILKVDNVDVLDPTMCTMFFAALDAMAAKAGIDNIVAAGVGLRGRVSEGWTIHQVAPFPPPEFDPAGVLPDEVRASFAQAETKTRSRLVIADVADVQADYPVTVVEPIQDNLGLPAMVATKYQITESETQAQEVTDNAVNTTTPGEGASGHGNTSPLPAATKARGFRCPVPECECTTKHGHRIKDGPPAGFRWKFTGGPFVRDTPEEAGQ